MKATSNIIRTLLIAALGIVAFLCIFSEPAEDTTSWLADFILSKSLGALACLAIYGIHVLWPETNNANQTTK